MKKIKVIIYARVSTMIQEYEHQIEQLKEYTDKMGDQVVKTFSEKISGAKKVKERMALMELLEYIEDNPVDKILIYECSQLSRRVLEFLSVVEQLNEMGSGRKRHLVIFVTQ